MSPLSSVHPQVASQFLAKVAPAVVHPSTQGKPACRAFASSQTQKKKHKRTVALEHWALRGHGTVSVQKRWTFPQEVYLLQSIITFLQDVLPSEFAVWTHLQKDQNESVFS